MVKLAAASWRPDPEFSLAPRCALLMVIRTYSVQNVDEFALLHGADHDRATLRVGCEVLAGDDTPRAGATVRLLVELVEDIVCRVIFEDDDPARVGSDDEVVWGDQSQPYGRLRRGWAVQGDGPFAPPVSLKAEMLRIWAKTSASTMLSSFPVLASMRRSSMRSPPRVTQISCCLVPLKFPTHACVMAAGAMSEWWYR